jgi:hypothetical protein
MHVDEAKKYILHCTETTAVMLSLVLCTSNIYPSVGVGSECVFLSEISAVFSGLVEGMLNLLNADEQ